MEVDTKNRTELKSYFVRNSIPTEGNFAELIDAMLNQREDGMVKLAGEPLSIEGSGDDTSQKQLIALYRDFADVVPSWVLSLNPHRDPRDPATGRPGFNIGDGEGNSRFFIDRDTGNVGIGTMEPRGFQIVLPEGGNGSSPAPGVTISGGASGNASIELRNAGLGTPYIDFAQDGTRADYDARIRLTEPGKLAIEGANVGVGTAKPQAKVTIQQGGTDAGGVANGKTLFVSGPTKPGLEYDGGIEFRHDNLTQGIGFGYQAVYATGSNANQPLHLYARGNAPLTLNAFGGGNVGIGTTNPRAALTVDGSLIRRVSVATGLGPNDGTDAGQIRSRVLNFNKLYDDTAVRILYCDVFRVGYGSTNKGSRWEIRVDGSPPPGGAISICKYSSSGDYHDPSMILGYATGLRAGRHQIQVWLAPVPGYPVNECYTGWNNSRWTIEAEEVWVG